MSLVSSGSYETIHSLGAELVGVFAPYANNQLIDNQNGTYTLTVVDDGKGCFVSIAHLLNSYYAVEINIISATDLAGVVYFWDGTSSHQYQNTLGETKYEYRSQGTGGDCRFDGIAIGTVITFSISLKEITLPAASYLYYYDETTGKIKALSSTGDVGENIETRSIETLNAYHATVLADGTITATATDGHVKFGLNLMEVGKRYNFSGVLTNNGTVTARALATLMTGLTGVGVSGTPDGIFDVFAVANDATARFEIRPDVINGVDSCTVHTYSVREALQISTQYSVTDPHRYAFTTATPLSAADIAVLESSLTAVEELYLGLLILPSGFDGSDIVSISNLDGLGMASKYLPKYYNKTEGQWYDLNRAYEETIKGWGLTIANFRNGYIFSLANEVQLQFMEELLKVPVDTSLSIDYRVGRLQAKLLPAATTQSAIIHIAKQFYPNENPVISEVEADYTLTIFFSNMQVLPTDIAVFKDTIEEIIQADIDFSVLLDVAMAAFTHTDLSAHTYADLTGYRYGN